MKTIQIFYLVVATLLLFGCTSSKNTSSLPNAPFNAEVRFQFNTGTGIMTATVTNRNDYNWTNLSVIADDYYPCMLSTTAFLGPNDQAYVTVCTDRKNPPLTSLSKLDVKTDQGEETYIR